MTTAIEAIRRDRCVVDASERLEPLYRFRDFPVYMGCTDEPAGGDLSHDMSWMICADCGCVQLGELIPADILYARSHNSGLVGGLWARHHQEFAEFILRFSPRTVLEIGAGHGLLSINAHKQRPDIDWTVIEPNPTPQPGCRARFIKGFFPVDLEPGMTVDALVHSHFLEHLFQPDVFFAQAAAFVGAGSFHIFSVPNMRVMLERKYTNCLNFEHTYYLTEDYIEAFLARAGFEIVDRRLFLDDHSIFYATRKLAQRGNAMPPADGYAHNRRLYEDYVRFHEDEVAQLNRFIADNPGQVFLFGAHVFSQYLCAFGLRHEDIRAVLDNDASKQGRRLAGTGLTVASPDVLRGIESPAVILRAGVYNDEIRTDILANINPHTRFL